MTYSRRLAYLVSAVSTIAVGLLVHLRGDWLGSVAHDVLGDALWAAMMFWWLGAVAPRAKLGLRAMIAYGIAVAVELSQLVHAPWLEVARATRLGRLVLGSGFDPRDLAAYAVGIAGAVAIEAVAVRWANRRKEGD